MAYLIVVLAVLSRFAPHPGNFTPVFGALVFAGAYLRKRYSIWFPVAILGLSDIILTTRVYNMRFHWTDCLEWAGYIAVVLVGWSLRGRVRVKGVLAAALAGPTAFFLISNFTVWLGWRMYPPTWQGLIECFAAGLPFFRNSLLSGLLYTMLLFGAFGLYRRKRAENGSHAANVHIG